MRGKGGEPELLCPRRRLPIFPTPSLLTPASKYTSPTTAFLRHKPPIGFKVHAITMESFTFYFRKSKGWTLIFSRPASSLLDGISILA